MDFISNRGNHTITSDAASLRKALAVGNDLYIEANLSANGICDVLRKLLSAYEIPIENMKVFLREDRDAGRST